ncbi:hypothetical protein NL676_035157 [Syzygium grande]|nr:hypothetical protein NL676_035157 [Syzygium grande]
MYPLLSRFETRLKRNPTSHNPTLRRLMEPPNARRPTRFAASHGCLHFRGYEHSRPPSQSPTTVEGNSALVGRDLSRSRTPAWPARVTTAFETPSDGGASPTLNDALETPHTRHHTRDTTKRETLERLTCQEEKHPNEAEGAFIQNHLRFSLAELFLAASLTFSMYPSIGGVSVAMKRFARKGVKPGTSAASRSFSGSTSIASFFIRNKLLSTACLAICLLIKTLEYSFASRLPSSTVSPYFGILSASTNPNEIKSTHHSPFEAETLRLNFNLNLNPQHANQVLARTAPQAPRSLDSDSIERDLRGPRALNGRPHCVPWIAPKGKANDGRGDETVGGIEDSRAAHEETERRRESEGQNRSPPRAVAVLVQP